MNIHEAYKRLSFEINKNGSRAGVGIEPGEFALRYNIEKDRYALWKLKAKNSNYIEDMSELLVGDIRLQKIAVAEDHVVFKLPSDFLRDGSSYTIASKGRCSNIALYTNVVNPKEKDLINRFNHLSRPSFEYQETNAIITDDKVNVFFTDFEITAQVFSYYRKLKSIAFGGVELADGSVPSSDIHPDDFSDHWIDEIISRVALSVRRSYQDQLGYELEKDNINNES